MRRYVSLHNINPSDYYQVFMYGTEIFFSNQYSFILPTYATYESSNKEKLCTSSVIIQDIWQDYS